MKRLVIIGALAMSGCETMKEQVAPLPAVVCAEVEPEPVAPAVTSEQELAIDIAIARAVGEEMGAAWIRYRDVAFPAWGRRQAARLEEGRKLCPE